LSEETVINLIRGTLSPAKLGRRDTFTFPKEASLHITGQIRKAGHFHFS